MDKILGSIISNLMKKGLSPAEIPGFMKDFCRIIDRGQANNPKSINQGLRNLGWQDSIADYYLLELMVYLHERNEEYRTERDFFFCRLAETSKTELHV
jgi:hypothetical protein